MYRGQITAMSLMGRRFITVTSPELAQEVLLTRADAFRESPLVRRMLTPAMGDGLLTAEGDSWAAQRRAAAPAFRPRGVAGLGPGISRIAAAAAESMACGLPASGAARVDMARALQRVTLDVVVASLFGDGAAEGVDRAGIARDVERYLGTHGNIELADYLGLAEGWPRRRHLGRAAVARLRRAAAAVARGARDGGADGAAGLLGLLRGARDGEAGLSEAQLTDNVVTFIGAGHETVAVGVTWALSILAHLPELQQALAAEVARACPDRPAAAEDAPALALTGRVIEETMRLYPPAPAVGRAPLEPMRLGGLDLTPDDHVTVAVWVIHRHRDHWPEPSLFDPARFAPGAPARHRFAYMPFGGGPRICIGAGLARAEMTILLAELMRRLRVAPEPGRAVRPRLSITLRPQGGMPLRVSRAPG